MNSKSLSNCLIKILVALMPFHIFVFNYFKNSKGLILWRDILAIVIFILSAFFVKKGKARMDKTILLLIISWCIGLVHAFLFHDSKMAAEIWLNTYRVYFFPSLIYIIIFNSSIDENLYYKIKSIYVNEAFFICIFGIVQQLFIGKSFIEFMGYRRDSITFSNGVQRNIGLFDSANIMAVFLLFAMIICLEDMKVSNGKYIKIQFATLLAGFILTFSFSSYIAFVLALMVRSLYYSNNISDKIFKFIKVLLIFTFVGVFILLIDRVFLHSMIYNQLFIRILDIYMAVTAENIYDISSSSAAAHLISIIEPIHVLKSHVLGVGFSTGTFMVLGKVSPLPYAVESSLFTILYDFGLFAGLVYMVPYFMVFNSLKNEKKQSIIAELIGFSMMVVFIVLPLVQSYELRFYFFLFFSLSKVVKPNNIKGVEKTSNNIVRRNV